MSKQPNKTLIGAFLVGKGGVMKIRTAVMLVVLLLSIGCAHRVEIQQLPPDSEDFLPSEVGLLIPAIVRSTDLRINGNKIEPGEEFTRLVLQKVQRTHVFLQVTLPGDSGKIKMREKAVNLELSISGEIETKEATNLIKFAVNCATLFLFSSTLQYKDEFDITMVLRAVRYDGEERYYENRIQGATFYRIFEGVKAREETQDQVVTKTLNALMRQLMGDIDFYAMEE
jgi:hypothetical protein